MDWLPNWLTDTWLETPEIELSIPAMEWNWLTVTTLIVAYLAVSLFISRKWWAKTGDGDDAALAFLFWPFTPVGILGLGLFLAAKYLVMYKNPSPSEREGA
jgi:hypothetical protein